MDVYKEFQLCCGLIKNLLKKLYGYKNVHVKNFVFIETSEGLNNHLKVDYIVFKDGGALSGAEMFNSAQLKREYVPEEIFYNYWKTIR